MGQRYQTKFFASQRNVSGDARPKFAAWSCAQYVNQPGAFSGASIQAAPAQKKGQEERGKSHHDEAQVAVPGRAPGIMVTMAPRPKATRPRNRRGEREGPRRAPGEGAPIGLR